MTADHLSYKRAATVSVLGLGIQIVLGVALLLYGLFGQDSAAQTGAYAVLLGIPIWGALALVFHQHRLERLEALEAEAYATSSAAEASVFEGTAADQLVQSNRLAWMHTWFLPTVSLLVAAVYLALGFGLFFASQRHPNFTGIFEAPPHSGWAIPISVGVFACGFIFARFVAGMAKQEVWSLLHAGSAAAVGAALVGILLSLGHFLEAVFNWHTLLRYLPLILSVGMALLGAEIVLNFVLNQYRPRRAGEYLRPALDSRILAFLAAPDRLAETISDAVNYQFGFEVSSTWFYRLIRRSVIGLGLLGGLILWLMSAFVVIQPNETALLLRNGELTDRPPLESGLILKRPWPFDRIVRYPTQTVSEFLIGTPVRGIQSARHPLDRGHRQARTPLRPGKHQRNARWERGGWGGFGTSCC